MDAWATIGASLGEETVAALRAGPEPDASASRLADLLTAAPSLGDPALGRPLAAISATRALPAIAAGLGDDARVLLAPKAKPASIAGDPGDPAAAIRRTVRAGVLRIAALDLTGRLDMPGVGRSLSDLADEAAAAALSASGIPASTRLAVIALGKWGGRELNYASDIDLVFVHDGDEGEAVAAAGRFVETLTARTADGIAFRVDVDLRPEGRAGPLSRSLDSYRAYWERWAETWELQAMIKARHAAGDRDLGTAFLDVAAPFVFPDTLGADAVRDIRAMKERTERLAGDDEVKRGVGGIRDVEFAVQLLQLVHGRADAALRTAGTLEALRLLGDGGYVRAQDGEDLDAAYRWLRNVEHRLQLYDLRQTHTLPADEAGRTRVAKAMGYRDDPGGHALDRFEQALVERRSVVRTIHERLFYRPLLEAFAASSGADARAERQASAFGFTDSEATRRAIADLTAGLSRRSRLMQQLLPLMMRWLSESPDPDLGLGQLRLLVTSAADHDAVIAVLRDNPATAERLCTLLGTSRLAGRLIDRLPPSLSRIGDDQALAASATTAALSEEVAARLTVRADPGARAEALQRFGAQHLLEISAADVAGIADDLDVGRRLAAVADAVVAAALDEAVATVGASSPVPPMAVIALGKWGGHELNYASDLDAVVVYRGEGAEADAAACRATEEMIAVLGRSKLDLPSFDVDLDLRPEGKRGAIARSLAGYQAYWDRWAETWEFQALLRARPAAGDDALAADFMAAARQAAPHPIDDAQRREIRAMKARVEQERIPVGEDPDFHMKLGRGGMSDVEWTVQMLQMEQPTDAARTPSTIEGLRALAGAGAMSEEDATALEEAYRFCARVRNRLFLRAGRPLDSLPADQVEAARLAVSLGYEVNPRSSLREEYRRRTRRARRVMERVFYGR